MGSRSAGREWSCERGGRFHLGLVVVAAEETPSGMSFEPVRFCLVAHLLLPFSCNEPSYLCLPRRSPRRAGRCPCPPCPIPTGHCIALNIIVKVLPRVGIHHGSDDLRYCIVAELYTELCTSPVPLVNTFHEFRLITDTRNGVDRTSRSPNETRMANAMECNAAGVSRL